MNCVLFTSCEGFVGVGVGVFVGLMVGLGAVWGLFEIDVDVVWVVGC